LAEDETMTRFIRNVNAEGEHVNAPFGMVMFLSRLPPYSI